MTIPKAVFGLLFVVLIGTFVDADISKSQFQTDFSITYNNDNFALRGMLYYDGLNGNMRIDYILYDRGEENIVSHFYESDRHVYEVSNTVCSKYSAQESYIPLAIPSDAMYTESYIDGQTLNTWTSRTAGKTIRWFKDLNDELKMIQIISPWGIEKSISFLRIQDLELPIRAPSYEVSDMSSLSYQCNTLNENAFSQISTCDNECSHRGLCIASSCYCFNEFGGSDCSLLPNDVKLGVCGNGILEDNEECDDGNITDDDCCSNECRINLNMVSASCLTGNSCKKPLGTCSLDGICEAENDPNGFCSDQNECTDDRCVEGTCVSTPKELNCSDLPFPYFGCSESYGCDPKTGSCLYKPVDDGERCSGSTSCSGVCRSGKCVDEEFTCNSSMICQESVCDIENGQCINTPTQDGTPCDSGYNDECKSVCQEGVCVIVDALCPLIPTLNAKDIVMIVDNNSLFNEIGSQILRRWEDASKLRVALFGGNVESQGWEDINAIEALLNQNTQPITDLQIKIVQSISLFTHESNARVMILMVPMDDNTIKVLSEVSQHIKDSMIELFIISTGPDGEKFATRPYDIHFFDINTQASIDIVNRLTDEKAKSKRQGFCGDGVVNGDEECEPYNNPCCTEECTWLVCADGDCKTNGFCVAGECVYEYENCDYLTQGCVKGICYEGICLEQLLEPGSSCDDGDLCTIDDQCDATGTCVGEDLICDSIFDICMTGRCNPETGQCIEIGAGNGTDCLDEFGHGYCLDGSCSHICPEYIDTSIICDPNSPFAGVGGICCVDCQPVNDELADCADLSLYDESCIDISYCSGGTCRVLALPDLTECYTSEIAEGFCEMGICRSV